MTSLSGMELLQGFGDFAASRSDGDGYLLGLLMCLAGSLSYAGVTLPAWPRLSVREIALLQFVYPLAVVLMDWLVCGRTLQSTQLRGVALMALALGAVN